MNAYSNILYLTIPFSLANMPILWTDIISSWVKAAARLRFETPVSDEIIFEKVKQWKIRTEFSIN